MIVQPIEDRVLIKPIATDDGTDDLLFIPGKDDEPKDRAIVVAVGAGTKDTEMLVSEGDTIMFKKYGGDKIEIDGEDHLIVRQAEIVAIIKGEE